MGRSKAARPRRRVGQRFEPLAAAQRPAQFAALSSAAGGALFTSSATSGGGVAAASGDDSGGRRTFAAAGAGAAAESTLRPRPSLPFASALAAEAESSGSSPASAADGANGSSSADSEPEMVTIARSELEKWQQKVIFQVEDHFANEQLKRIAEFGRVHASLVVEAKEYVFNVERRMTEQFEQQRASLRAQAEAYVAKKDEEVRVLQSRVAMLERELAALRADGKEREEEDETRDEDMDMERASIASSHEDKHAEQQEDGEDGNEDEEEEGEENHGEAKEPRGYTRLNGLENDQENNPYALNSAQKPEASEAAVKARGMLEKRPKRPNLDRKVKHKALTPKMPSAVAPPRVNRVIAEVEAAGIPESP